MLSSLPRRNGCLMSAPVARGEQRRLSVIRVDLELPVAEGYVDATLNPWGAAKYVARAGKAAVRGRTVDQQAAQDRLENFLKQVQMHFDDFSRAGTMRTTMNTAMKQYKIFLTLYAQNFNEYDDTASGNVWYTDVALQGMKELIQSILRIIASFKSSKTDNSFMPTFVAYYNALVIALTTQENLLTSPPCSNISHAVPSAIVNGPTSPGFSLYAVIKLFVGVIFEFLCGIKVSVSL